MRNGRYTKGHTRKAPQNKTTNVWAIRLMDVDVEAFREVERTVKANGMKGWKPTRADVIRLALSFVAANADDFGRFVGSMIQLPNGGKDGASNDA